MSRYCNELNCLLAELRDRYGDRDDSVQQVKHELEAVEARESAHQDFFARGRSRLFNRSGSGRYSWDWSSSLLHLSQRPSQPSSEVRAGKQSSTT